MTQPTRYTRQYNATGHSVAAPTVPHPGAFLDAEFNALKVTLDETLDNLALIQRDDGELANASVGVDQLDAELQTGFSGVGSITVSADDPSGDPGAGTHLWFKTA